MGCWLPPCRRRRRAALLHARNTRTLCDSHLMFFAFDMSKLMTWLKAVAPENISLYQAEDAVTAEEDIGGRHVTMHNIKFMEMVESAQ